MKYKLAAMVVALCLAGAVWGLWDLYRPFPRFAGREMVEIAPGSSAPAIADLLVARGVLAHKGPFLVRYWIGHTRHRLKAGEYLFDRPLRPIDVYRKLISGDVYLYSVVIPEGSDRFDIARILAERMAIDPDDFLRRTEQASLLHDLDPEAPSLEGYLFPDTYRFPRRVTADTVIATMLDRLGLAGGEGNSRPGGAAGGSRGLRAPARKRHAAPVRSHGDLRGAPCPPSHRGHPSE